MHSSYVMLLHAVFYLSRDRPSVHVVPLGNTQFVHHARTALGKNILIYKREPNLAETFIHAGPYRGHDAVQLTDQTVLWEGDYLNGVVAENMVRNSSGCSGFKEPSGQQNFPRSICLVKWG